MKLSTILDYITTMNKEAVETREKLRNLFNSVKGGFAYKKSIKPFCFAGIDDAPMGERLIIKRTNGDSLIEVDIAHSPDSYKKNQIAVKQPCPTLVTKIEQYLTERGIPHKLNQFSK